MSKLGVKLIATPLSHYARKVRILLDLYKIPYEFCDIVGNIAFTKKPNEVGDHPLMKVPVLQHGTEWLVESDHIAQYLVGQFDPTDKYNVMKTKVFDLNTRAILNGLMNEELKVIVAKRHGVPVEEYQYFNKARSAVGNGLEWLESNHQNFDTKAAKYREFHLVCMWDHLQYYDFVPKMNSKYPRLYEVVCRVSEDPVIKQTAPYVLVPK